MEIGKKLISNTYYLVIAWVSSIILNFIFQLLAAKTLLPEELGIMSTAINFSAILSTVLVFGMEQTTQRITSYSTGLKNNNYLKSVLWFFFLFTISFNIIVISLLFLFSADVSSIIKIPEQVLFVSILVLFPLSLSFFFAGILRGYQNMRYLAVSAIISDFLKIFTATVLILTGFKIFGFMIGYLVAAITMFVLRFGTIKLFITQFHMPKVGMVLTHAIPPFITQLFWLLLLSGQYIIISMLQNTYATGIFTVGMILSNQIYFIPRIISDALFPISSKLSSYKSLVNRQRNLLNIALRYSFLISLPILFFVSIFPKPLIFLIGRVSFFPAADIVPILVTASLFFGIATLLSRTLYAIGKPIVFQNISIASIAVYLILSVILTIRLSFFGTSIAYLITTLFMTMISAYFLKKYMQFTIDIIPLSKIFLSSIVTFSLLYFVSFFTPNLIVGGILAAVFTLIYFVILYIFNFYDMNDIMLLNSLTGFPYLGKCAKLLESILSRKIENKPKSNKN